MNLTPCPLLINSEWLQPNIPGTLVFNPSTGEIMA